MSLTLASYDAHAICGVSVRFSAPRSGSSSLMGSVVRTSQAAPDMIPRSSASRRAFSSATAPLAVFSAVITDIMMGDMDGFMFRDIVRGFDPTVPIFFLTALDPEEGGGFLKKILDDPISYYLPKAVPTNVLLKRVRQVVASHRVEMFIQNKMDEDRKSLELAAHIQRSLLPIRAIQTPRGFYSIYWRPADIVSGDLIEAIRYGTGSYLYVLGDIQGHGTSAALAMTAVQSFLKNLLRSDGAPLMTPDMIANMIQSFFRANLAEVSYMTVLICIHRPLLGTVQWISCGAPDLIVVENGEDLPINPEKKGGVPIGLFPDTVYTANDVVETSLSHEAICVINTTERDARIDLTLFYEDRPVKTGYSAVCGAMKTHHIRLDKQVSDKGELIPRDTPYAILVESSEPIVVQYSRLDTSAVEMALMTTIAYPVD